MICEKMLALHTSLLTLGMANGQLYANPNPTQESETQLGIIGNWASKLGVGFSNFATSVAAPPHPWLLWIRR